MEQQATPEAPTRSQQQKLSNEQQIEAAFTAPIKRVRPGFLYNIGLFLTAVFMIALPLLYISLIGCLGYVIYWHAANNLDVLQGSGNIRGRALLYFTPLVAGPIAIFFLIKPLFAGRIHQIPARRLSPKTDPLLFLLVSRICQTVSAPFPSAIEVNLQVNASAHFEQGFKGLFTNKLILTLGLPLVGGLDIRELTGVLAHEFGHFSQSFGMRFTYIIRSINSWFNRVVYERDKWDAQLESASQNSGCYIGIILFFAKFCVAISRVILRVLMLIGNTVSSFMLRQMEYNADLYEIRVAGSETFERTAQKLALLNAASAAANQVMNEGMQANKIPENYPKVVLDIANQLPEDVINNIKTLIFNRKTGIFDSHPADADRIAQARNAANPGIFKLKGPATALFGNFDLLTERETNEHTRLVAPHLYRHNV